MEVEKATITLQNYLFMLQTTCFMLIVIRVTGDWKLQPVLHQLPGQAEGAEQDQGVRGAT